MHNSDNQKQSVEVYITGDVTGVGFRSYIKNNAQKLNIKGWVKNVYLPQRAVEAHFEGSEESIKEIIKLCKKGPEVSWVENVKVKKKKKIENYNDFTVKAS